jgi:hypothetical protein
MSREDSYGYDPMPLDGKALLKDYATNVTMVLLI